MVAGFQQEEDSNELLHDDNHKKNHYLIDLFTWFVVIGRFDVAFATTSLSRFSHCPRKGHLNRVLRVFGYLRSRPTLRLICDSRNPVVRDKGGALDFDFTECQKG